jgi:hypothetical protein
MPKKGSKKQSKPYRTTITDPKRQISTEDRTVLDKIVRKFEIYEREHKS